MWPTHRVITVTEPQRLVVFGSTALFTTVEQLRICTYEYVGKKGEKKKNTICLDRIKVKVRSKIHWQDSNLQPRAWASNSGEENDSVDFSATGPSEFVTSKHLGVT